MEAEHQSMTAPMDSKLKHLELIQSVINRMASNSFLAWHHAGRPSNGRIEGTNNLLQVLRRTAHGFTNTANFEARGLLIT